MVSLVDAMRKNLSYTSRPRRPSVAARIHVRIQSGSTFAFIGAGNFAARVLIPKLPRDQVNLKTVVSSQGVSAAHAVKKFGFENATSDLNAVLADPDIDAIFVATPHHLHATMVSNGLEAGKHVFVEKPLCLQANEIEAIRQTAENSSGKFNGRFQPTFFRLICNRFTLGWRAGKIPKRL